MKESDIKDGQAFWGILNGTLHVFRKIRGSIFVADGWEDSIQFDKIISIELIKAAK